MLTGGHSCCEHKVPPQAGTANGVALSIALAGDAAGWQQVDLHY